MVARRYSSSSSSQVPLGWLGLNTKPNFHLAKGTNSVNCYRRTDYAYVGREFKGSPITEYDHVGSLFIINSERRTSHTTRQSLNSEILCVPSTTKMTSKWRRRWLSLFLEYKFGRTFTMTERPVLQLSCKKMHVNTWIRWQDGDTARVAEGLRATREEMLRKSKWGTFLWLSI